MSSYIGITIGPIIDTLILAHSPAAMWYASFMFSSLTENICERISQKTGKPEKIISPFFDAGLNLKKDGIGRYHDRLIVEGLSLEDAKTIAEESKEYIAENVAKHLGKEDKEKDDAVKFVKDYLQVHIVEMNIDDGINPILAIGKKLDALELMVSPNPDNTNNPFVELFKGRDYRNDIVIERLKEIAGSQLKKGGRLKSITDVACPRDHFVKNKDGKEEDERTLKREYYYAVVEADGDKMGTYINSLKTDELRAFSKRCMDCAGKSAEIIGKYGGMTVYAGGDDLLFLAPVDNEDSKLTVKAKDKEGNETEKPVKTVYGLCKVLSDEFKKNIKDGTETTGETPTLSFGIAVRREKFPLYEALNAALEALLFAAKDDKIGRDAMAIDFEKGSGQGIKMLIPFGEYECFDKISDLYSNGASDDNLKSAIYAIERSAELFKKALEDPKIAENVIKNTFDNEGQKKYEKFLKNYTDCFKDFINRPKILALGTDMLKDQSAGYLRIIAFENMLRLSKFMLEKKGEE